jgi:hypothetical protein
MLNILIKLCSHCKIKFIYKLFKLYYMKSDVYMAKIIRGLSHVDSISIVNIDTKNVI